MVGEDQIASIVAEVINRMGQQKGFQAAETVSHATDGSEGIFSNPDLAIQAAADARLELVAAGLDKRRSYIKAIRQAVEENVEEIARLAVEETGLGRVEDKIKKKLFSARLTPGVEDIASEAYSGENGLILIERAPVGLIASIEPATHPGSCVINHAISMLSAGNSVYFLPHPKGIKTTQYLVTLLNRAIRSAGGPANLLVVSDKVTLELVDYVLSHPQVDMIVATGGPDMTGRALRSGKKAIAAGPGNPPCLVDETAKDLSFAAECIVAGAGFDNTVLCIAEKSIIAIDKIADQLLIELQAHGAFLVKGEADINKLMNVAMPDSQNYNPAITGKDISLILKQAGLFAPANTRIAIIECSPEHPLVLKEQLFPILPFVRVADFSAGLNLAEQAEHGYRHTAVIHSSDVNRITEYSKRLKVDIMVANAPSAAGLNIGGEGHFSHTIASPTGEGICTAKTYTREQRTILAGSLRTVD